ncbi:glycosyltransferase family 4 protein [Vibrio harveyi]|nr:glycosyltransferase family 4 protein [Vibrio harveyi]
MKVLYLHQYFATPNSNGGTRSYEMAKRLIKNGHEVVFVTTSAFISDCDYLKKGWNEVTIEGMKLHVLHMPYSNADGMLYRVFKFVKFSILATLKSLKIHCDVILATSTPLTIAIPGVIYSKIKRKPMVFEVRDLWPELPIAVGAIKSPILISISKWLEKWAYKNATRLIGLSPGMCDGIRKQGIESSKITLATNSCDTDLFDIHEDIGRVYKREKLPFVGERKLIVYTGTFGIINNVDYIIDLAKFSLNRNDNVCFVAIGAGMKKQDIINRAQDEGVFEKNLFILEPVPKTEIVKLLSAADLSLSLFGPIKEMWHNSANKLFDALASGTPIAINYGGWQKELIEKHKCGVVLHETNFELSANIIEDFLSDSAKYTKAKLACKDLAYNHYSRDIMANRLEKALLEAVNDEEAV